MAATLKFIDYNVAMTFILIIIIIIINFEVPVRSSSPMLSDAVISHTRPGIGTVWSVLEVNRTILTDRQTHTHPCIALKKSTRSQVV